MRQRSPDCFRGAALHCTHMMPGWCQGCAFFQLRYKGGVQFGHAPKSGIACSSLGWMKCSRNSDPGLCVACIVRASSTLRWNVLTRGIFLCIAVGSFDSCLVASILPCNQYI
ncbi:hypothetical protein CC80DRAFT_271716 [Byssothecium circinans]|uniref:Uncharacterized protein n=1 Tax=Byssothecium circinans TaxID=147558 RepID=A0A6A5TB82_9PLEO|nr:hypothetical protein CC80DRAFT_271716 [Byssothecium circinans]